MNNTIIIKCGGSVLNSESEIATLCENVQVLITKGFKPLIVHGGGPEINRILKQFNLRSDFYKGLRVTTPKIAEVAQMALIGINNTKLVGLFNRYGINAVGLSGGDGNLLIADYLDWVNLGYVGVITTVATGLLKLLIDGGIVPVIAPLAVDSDGNILNVNADLAASAIAVALAAQHLVLLSDIDGYYAAYPDKNSWVARLGVAEVIQLLAKEGQINDGMIPKLQACADAVSGGVKSACILNGMVDYNIYDAVTKPGNVGTTVMKEVPSCKSE